MELNDLKYLWQQNQELLIMKEVIDNEEVIEMSRQKSKDLMTKLRTNLNLDAVVSSTFIPPLIYILFVKNIATYHKYIAAFFIVYTCVGLYYYIKEIQSYKELNLKNDLLSTLTFTKKKFSQRVKSLIIYNNIAIVPLMFYGSILGSEIAQFRGSNFQPTVVELIFSTIIMTPVSYFYMQFIIKKLYGENLQKFKELLAELEQD
ncbi:MAG: hypothetical protein H7339_09945 [Arcicella sp.]|nr:hypothetical protein [Arcicella sp.]